MSLILKAFRAGGHFRWGTGWRNNNSPATRLGRAVLSDAQGREREDAVQGTAQASRKAPTPAEDLLIYDRSPSRHGDTDYGGHGEHGLSDAAYPGGDLQEPRARVRDLQVKLKLPDVGPSYTNIELLLLMP
jgi:hypothetical protein